MSSKRNPHEFTISPSDIHYFCETANVLNFSRAAERLGIAQPSLTQAIQRIEYAVGENVFTRHKRGVTLTPAGKHLLTQSRTLLQCWEEIRATASSSMTEIRGRFTLGCHPSVALFALNSFLPKLLSNKKIEIKLVHDLSRKITEQVISNNIDIGFAVNPVRHPDLMITKLYDDVVTFWATDHLMKNKSYMDEATIIYDPAISQSQVLLRKTKSSQLNIFRSIESSNLEVVASLTASGIGIGILPTRVANLAPKKLSIVPGTPTYKDEICLVTRVENKKVAGIQHICKLIKETAE